MINIILTCTKCDRKFERSVALHNSDLKRGRNKFFCSKACLGILDAKPITTRCNNCGEIIMKSNRDARKSKSGRHYCSVKCAVSDNNKYRIHKLQTRTCVECGTEFTKSKNARCAECLEKWKSKLMGCKKMNISKQDITSCARYVANKHGLLTACAVCGYSFHVDACHIKAVGKFSQDALINEINAIKNLIGLCRNHHWEFDHGGIKGFDDRGVMLVQ